MKPKKKTFADPGDWLRHLMTRRDLRKWRQCSEYGWTGLHEVELAHAKRLEAAHAKYSVTFDAQLLADVFEFLRSQDNHESVEDQVWLTVIRLSCAPLPEPIALELAGGSSSAYWVKRALCDSRQALAVYYRLADANKYARSRLFIRLFVGSDYGVDDLRRYLDRYGMEAAGRIARGRRPDDPAKWQAFPEPQRTWLQESLQDEGSPERNHQVRRNDKRRVIMSERMREQQRIQAAKEQRDRSDMLDTPDTPNEPDA